MKNLAISMLALTFLVGCASTEDLAASDEPKEERIYTTGSMLPQRKDRAKEVQTLSAGQVKDAMGSQARGRLDANGATGGN